MTEEIKEIGDYKKIKEIGSGSFGEVYLFQHKKSLKFYAIKKVDTRNSNPKLKKYLDYEIQIMSKLHHPNIVKMEEDKVINGSHYIIMEYINGGSLSDHLRKYKLKYGKAFPEGMVQHLMRQIVSALVCIHDNNIIHRDLKLENIMVHFDSEYDKEESNMMRAKVKIIDFGFAIILPTTVSLTNSAVGTFYYMDPKILDEFYHKALVDKNRGYGKEADIWSLGILCYELLRGKKPFEADSFEDLVDKIKNYGQYRLPKTVSLEIYEFLHKMLRYDGKDRLSARELMHQPFLTKNLIDFKKIPQSQSLQEKKEQFPIKDSIDLYKKKQQQQKALKEKEFKKFNSLQDKPIKEDDNLNKTQSSSNSNEIKRAYTSSTGCSFYGQPMSINPQPHMQNGMFHHPLNQVQVDLSHQSFPPPDYLAQPLAGAPNQIQFPNLANNNMNIINYYYYPK